MLKRVVEERWFDPKALIGFWPANAVGDDIRLYKGESRSAELATFFTLRQQLMKRDGRPNVALSDYRRPGRQFEAGLYRRLRGHRRRQRGEDRRAFCQGQR